MDLIMYGGALISVICVAIVFDRRISFLTKEIETLKKIISIKDAQITRNMNILAKSEGNIAELNNYVELNSQATSTSIRSMVESIETLNEQIVEAQRYFKNVEDDEDDIISVLQYTVDDAMTSISQRRKARGQKQDGNI